MKKHWKIVAIIDGIALVLLFALMVWFNSSSAYGVAALTDLGGFVVCFVLFQIALVLMLILGIAALITTLKKRK